ncbi:PAS domain S-box-containing protein/diguanylate cyclase (GGDEF) domain-containing protein [Paenibacillus sp. 1_12]|uniref:sensor domain-containing protein n=1 Tax=Paenibacillus sp. 1_12 TaxID=1566278 RepID=UPI0008E4CA69|nr:sensor domain-containing diguanylate cyclase [Paenibacillus sp. 1_12]SFK70836.1 PAS domain S-box-containing protein/diguanylate cyclase (GGDEF) domain-containing protein [Paenibacillus sp. 1_12]
MQPNPFGNDVFFRQLFNQSTDLIQGITLDSTLSYISPSCSTLLNRSPEELLGQQCYSHIYEDDLIRFQQALRQLIHEQTPFNIQYRYVLPNGSLIWLESKGSLIHMENSLAGVGFITRDVSEHKSIEEQLIQLAYYDSLTALPNRRLFHDRCYQSLLAAKRYHRKMALLYLDLDDFKLINDNYGHAVGDDLLKMVAARLSHCVRDPDTVCRLGGDEFVILLQQFEQKEDIVKVSERVLDAISSRFVIQHHDIFITCSMGAAYYPQDGTDGNELLDMADAAMYQAKKSGKNDIAL